MKASFCDDALETKPKAQCEMSNTTLMETAAVLMCEQNPAGRETVIKTALDFHTPRKKQQPYCHCSLLTGYLHSHHHPPLPFLSPQKEGLSV